MFNFGNNHWWINQLAQRTKTKNLLPKLQRAKSNEEEHCSVKHSQVAKNEKKLLGMDCQWGTKPLLFDQFCIFLYFDPKQLTVNFSWPSAENSKL